MFLFFPFLSLFPFLFTCEAGRPAVTDGSVLPPVGGRGSKVRSG